MKKTLVTIVMIILSVTISNAQLTQGAWLAGGNASFFSTDNLSSSTTRIVTTVISVSPSIGYFIADKFAVGFRPYYGYGGSRVTEGASTSFPSSSTSSYRIGPFARYYFLNPEKQFNLFAESSFMYGRNRTNNSGNITQDPPYTTLSFLAGPVLYFNSSVGLEFTIGYSTKHQQNISRNDNHFEMGLGFQVHLMK